MTRNQAISRAIELLSQDENNKEVVLKLKEIQEEMPLCHWTKKSILDTIEDYSINNGNILPLSSKLTSENKMPSNTVIRKMFGYTSREKFYEEYFPHIQKRKNKTAYSDKTEEYFINVFKENYQKICLLLNRKHIGGREYIKYRDKNTPSLNTIIRNLGLETYDELLYMVGFKKKQEPICSSVNISFNDSDTSNEELRSMIYEIKNKS